MDDFKRDLISLLHYFVERETDEEKEFIKDQKNCELKLCLSVSLSHYATKNDKVDLLKIHTKLYQSYQLLEDDINYDENYYYIKSQTVSHCTGIASSNSLDNHKIMSIETVVTKNKCKCETVFKTFVTKSDNEKKKKTQRSFTREMAKCEHSSNENVTHNRFSVIFSDEEDENGTPNVEMTMKDPALSVKPKLSKRPSLIKFKYNKISKKFERQTSVEKNRIVENDIKNLQPIKRPKSGFKRFFKNLFHKQSSVTADIKTIREIDLNTNASQVPFMRRFSTENAEMEKEKGTNILATINLTKGTKKFEIIKDDIPFIDEEDDDDDDEEEEDNDYLSLNRSRSSSFTESLIHFNFPVSPDRINKTIERLIEKMSCKCDKKNKEFISENLKLLAKNKELVQKNMDCMKPYDNVYNHYLDCEVLICKKKYLRYIENVHKSQESLQISTLCSICKDIDQHFQDNISSIFVPFLERINKQNKNDLCSCDEKKKKKITTHILKRMNAMKENGDFKDSFNWSTRHFKDCLSNFNSPSINPIINPFKNLIHDVEESVECTCNERRISEMSNLLLLAMDKKNQPLVNYSEINKFDNKCGHYLDCCQLSSIDSSGYLYPISSNSRNLSSSFTSVFFPNPLGNASNDQVSPGFELSKLKKSSFHGSVEHVDKCLKELKTIEEPILCDCDDRRLKCLAQFIGSLIYHKEIDEFNFNSHHFKSCSKKLSSSELSPSLSFSASPYNENSPVFDDYSPKIARKNSKRKHSVSIDSIKYLDQVLQDIKMENKIECPMETISCLLKCKKYELYEKGLRKVLDSNPNIENMRLFFYLTRMIVRHIDDPNAGENQEIKEILEFSERFLCKHFYEEIKSQNGLEKFILGIDSLD